MILQRSGDAATPFLNWIACGEINASAEMVGQFWSAGRVIAINCSSADKLWNGHSGQPPSQMPNKQISGFVLGANWKDCFYLYSCFSLLAFLWAIVLGPKPFCRISLFNSHFWDSALEYLFTLLSVSVAELCRITAWSNQREIIFAGRPNKLQLLVGEISVKFLCHTPISRLYTAPPIL